MVSALADNVPSEKSACRCTVACTPSTRICQATPRRLPSVWKRSLRSIRRPRTPTAAWSACTARTRTGPRSSRPTSATSSAARAVRSSSAALARVYEQDLPAGDAEVLRTPGSARRQGLAAHPGATADHLGALDALSRLQQVTGEHLEAVRALEKRARLTDDKTQKASYFYRAAQLCEKHQLDLKRTEDNYVRAIEVDAGYVPALTALAEVYRSQGDFLRPPSCLARRPQRRRIGWRRPASRSTRRGLCQQADDRPRPGAVRAGAQDGSRAH